MSVIFNKVCKDGKSRKHIKEICSYCNQEFDLRISKRKFQKHFCNIDCKRKYDDQNKIILNCDWCHQEFKKRKCKLQWSKSGLFFCTKKCKDRAQKLDGLKQLHPPHYGTSTKIDYRQIYKNTGKDIICKRCGYNEFESCVHIHHIDKNRENNNIENLIPLCANCHFGLHDNHWKLEDLIRN